jgi:hypothetical protein
VNVGISESAAGMVGFGMEATDGSIGKIEEAGSDVGCQLRRRG